MENISHIETLTNSVKYHSKTFGIIGVVAGAILVIYYCGSINYYPSGMTISDTLFFLWVVVVFGFYYSLVALAFFLASTFWVTIVAKPINFILKLLKRDTDFVFPFPKSDLLIVLVGGLFSNILILGLSYFKGHFSVPILLAIFLIGLIYTLIVNLYKKYNSSGSLLEYNGNKLNNNYINYKEVIIVFYSLIYFIPLLIGQVGGGVTRTTFETMGVRQKGITLYLDAGEYGSILEEYSSKGFISDLYCSDVCTVKNADILFTNIGTNTKIDLHGINGNISLVLPTNAIKLIAKANYNNTKVADTE